MCRGIIMLENPLVRPEFRSNLLPLLVSHLIFDLSLPRFILCPLLHLSFAFSVAYFIGYLAYILALP
jgi:hypothetical protein